MEDNAYWYRIWAMIASVAITLITSVAICSWHQDQLFKDMVMAGKDPIELACAQNSSQQNMASVCAKIHDGR